MATVMVVGSGGREHALAVALTGSPSVDAVMVAPGNAGTDLASGCENAPVAAGDVAALTTLAVERAVDLVVIGPELPLVSGLTDSLQARGVRVFGPRAAAARLEGSKSFCRDFCARHGVPIASGRAFTDAVAARAHLATLAEPPVVKAAGLAAGKGVVVAEDHDQAEQAVVAALVDKRFGAAGEEIVLEERLEGTEMSVLALCDGSRYELTPVAQDHKRLLDGDQGPNTGGMGAFVPSPVANDEVLTQVRREVIEPTLAGLAAEGMPYQGVLYAGIMVTTEGPRLLEYNCRFGDPETQAVVPLLLSDAYEVLGACADGRLDQVEVIWSSDAAVTIVVAADGYPTGDVRPDPVEGLDRVSGPGVHLFHAGTRLEGDDVVAAGGRVLAVTALAPDLATATSRAYEAVASVELSGAHYRHDIARVPDRAGGGR